MDSEIPKHSYQTSLLVIAFILIAAIILGGTHYVIQKNSTPEFTCAKTGKTIAVEVSGGAFHPDPIDAKRCDVLQITNKESSNLLPALGPHDHHADYPGFEEKILKPGDNTTIILKQAGNFSIHDHLADKIEGDVDIQ